MHQVQTLTTLVTTITADTREDTEVTEDMEATVASAVMAVVTNALAPPSDCSRPGRVIRFLVQRFPEAVIPYPVTRAVGVALLLVAAVPSVPESWSLV
jgi:hypothetical protein